MTDAEYEAMVKAEVEAEEQSLDADAVHAAFLERYMRSRGIKR